MTDEDLGTKILTLVCQTTAPNIRQKVGAAARELLTKPVATREEISKWMDKEHGGQWYSSSVILAAIQHFAAPERPKMIIETMSEVAIAAAFKDEWESSARLTIGPEPAMRVAACVAHRLANTPVPVVDEDGPAKLLAWKHYIAAIPDYSARIHKTPDSRWEAMHITDRVGWRAVAKELGGE